jgi:hypothetical protein
MSEDAQVVDGTQTPAATPPAPAEPAKPKLDPSQPMKGQVDKLLSQLPKEEPKVENKPKEEEPAPPKEEEPKTPEETTPAPATDEDEGDEVTPAPAVELPSWQKYILDNLPRIQTIGHTGDGKDKVYTVKRVEDLPADFEFADKRSELIFAAAVAGQEVTARNLLADYQRQEQQNQYAEFKNQEDLRVQADLDELHKEGVIPKFQYADDDPKFNDDPAVKLANEIYDVYDKTNASYARKNIAYRISYKDAADIYFGRQARAPKAPATPAPPSKERQEIAAKTGGTGTAPGTKRRPLPPGSTQADVYKLYKLGAL